ncbi:glycosyltransferase [Nitrogeniibacter mangrovi]|uniref:Glycosyltransferase n=1 Tax=Nitrogeniibacter mangrovi TaxID=2016596 RepID=A0A6C1AZ62_9RHOO|nr:glycosyltransferase [Nitrogeniibacter mangrovi]QID16661.1 glycosyltransferase [Nitrogeniibacter mangrovi]
MKSLHILGSKEMGGAERWLLRFVAAMQRAGEDIEVAVRRGSELDRHHLHDVPKRTAGMRTVWDPFSRWELSRLIADSGAPIVQTYMGRATRLTHVKRGRGQVHLSRLGGYYKLDPFRHAHAWIGNTRGLCDWMIAGGLPADRVFHITNFADPAKPADPEALEVLRRELAVQPEDWLMVTAGRLIDVKGHATLIEAMRQLPAELDGKRLRLILLGDGPLRETLERQVAEAGLTSRVHFAGWQQDPAPWFHLADMVVFPSRDRETLGNVILEAWAYGKPLACTAFRGAREIARHGEDALVSPCDDAAPLAAHMREIIDNPALQRQLIEHGLRRIEHDFGERVIIDQYRALYAQLLDNR